MSLDLVKEILVRCLIVGNGMLICSVLRIQNARVQHITVEE